jgi:L-2-hydroxycarboxylate dehydrogenase (NAD+)
MAMDALESATSGMPLYAHDDLLKFATDIFANEGVPADEAAEAAAVLLWASVRGVDTHGIRNLRRYYIDGIRNGAITPKCQLEVDRETPVAMATNANSSLGLVAATRAMRIAMDKAEATGVGLVTVRQSQHFGAAGAYAHMAAERNMIGIAMTGYFFQNGQSRAVVPFGGRLPMLSTNPIAFACPCGDRPPFVLDMSTSVVPVNRLELMSEREVPIPTGWGLDADGKPTTVAQDFESVLPLGGMEQLGGHKGFGLAMMVQILTSVLSAAWCQVTEPGEDEPISMPEPLRPTDAGGKRQPLRPVEARGSKVLGDRPEPRYGFAQEGVGQFFAAIRISDFLPPAAFQRSLETLLRCINESPPADGVDRVRVAGEPEAETMARRLATGIPLEPTVLASLCGLAEETGVAFPSPR